MNLGRHFWIVSLTGLIVLCGTIWGGWLHGRMATRWGADELLTSAGRRLVQPVSEQQGNWRLVKETPFSADVLRVLQCPAHINRAYVHQQTGEVVMVSVIIGPPGPIGAHTPEICYSSQDFELLGDRSPVTVVDRGELEHSFWQVSMEPRGVEHTSQRVLYAWGTGSKWSATENPRLEYAGQPYLYKIQLAGPLSAPDDEFKPCEDFLGWFLPEIQNLLVPTGANQTAAPPSES
jgi:uncharacterized protein DUF3485